MSHNAERGNLLLARRPGESITIGDDVEVTVVDLTSGKVRLAINAPRALPIVRGELRGDCRGPSQPPVTGPFLIRWSEPLNAQAAETTHELQRLLEAKVAASYARNPEFGLVASEDHEALDVVIARGRGRIGPLPDGIEIVVEPTDAPELIEAMVSRGDHFGDIPDTTDAEIVSAFNAPTPEELRGQTPR